MEYLIIFITHIIKSIDYFAVEGLPIIPLHQLPEAAEAIVFHLCKLITVYLLL